MAAALWLLFPGAASAAQASCLQCHRPHYQERGSCVSCHRGDDRSDRLRIAHHDLIPARFVWFRIAGAAPVRRGEKLMEVFACRRCHTSGGKGNRLASNLDRLPAGTTPQEIFDAIKSPAQLMPDFRLDDRQLADLVNAILAGAGKSGRAGKQSPQVVHFEAGRRDPDNIFAKQCGPCHKMLTLRLGGVGKGDVGPNLSGLFSKFYPPAAEGNRRWNAALLGKWLKNPREMRKNSQMRPVPLDKREFDRLLAVFAETP